MANRIPKKIGTKAGAALAVCLVAGGSAVPLIADELDITPTPTVAAGETDASTTTEATSENATPAVLAPHLTSNGTVYSAERDTNFRIELQDAIGSSVYKDVVVTNISDIASTTTWLPLDAVRGMLPEGSTFGNPVGSGGEIVKGSQLVEHGIAPAEAVTADADYWYIGTIIPSGGSVRLAIVAKEEPKAEPTPEAPSEPTPAPDTTPAPEKSEDPTPEPEKSGDATPAPSTDAAAPGNESTVVVDNTSSKANEVYKAPEEAAIPKDNAVRHDAAGRVVSTAPVTTINTDADTGTTVTRFEDGGEVTTNNAGEVVESTLGSTVTTTGTPVVSTPAKTSTVAANAGTSKTPTSTVKGQTLRTGTAGVANVAQTMVVSPAAVPLIAAGGSLALAGTFVAGAVVRNRKRSK